MEAANAEEAVLQVGRSRNSTIIKGGGEIFEESKWNEIEQASEIRPNGREKCNKERERERKRVEVLLHTVCNTEYRHRQTETGKQTHQNGIFISIFNKPTRPTGVARKSPNGR